MSYAILPTMTGHLAALEDAVGKLAMTWRPDDPEYRADLYRQIMMQLSFSYFAFFHADAEHPDWSPYMNPVYALQPNPDDIYLHAPVSSEFTYLIRGNRGTVKMLIFNTMLTLAGYPGEVDYAGKYYADLDDRDLEIDTDGNFEIVMSAERPEGHSGNWLQIKPGAQALMVRYRSYDWEGEVDPTLSIECLNPTRPKPRLSADEIAGRLDNMAAFAARSMDIYFKMQNAVRDAVGVNVFQPAPIGGALSRQIYLPAVFEFNDDEALILETEMPGSLHYWNFQLNDPYFNAIEYVYRLSSTNGHFAKLSSDGKFRAVISLADPGVPNWLDPAGFKQGTIYGRWYDADTCPTPTLKRVKFAELKKHLPGDTPTVSPEQRAEELRRRVRACQRRRRW